MIRWNPGVIGAVTAVACLSVLMTSCATGRIRNAFYQDEAKNFQVELPQNGWRVIQSPGTDLALEDTRSTARMAVAASCPEKDTDPLPSLVRHLHFGLRQVQRLRQEQVVMDGATGLDTIITGSWEGTAVQIRSVVIRRKTCLYDFLYVAPPEAFVARSADFDQFLQSWQFLPEQP